MCMRAALSQRREEGPHIADEKLGLLEGGEVTAFGHFAPVTNIGVSGLHPAPHRWDDFLKAEQTTPRWR
jgi:hypothetical protein